MRGARARGRAAARSATRAGRRSRRRRRARSGSRRARARRSSGEARSGDGTARAAVESQVSGASQGIVRRASSPHSPSSPSSSPAKTIGTPGVVICRPDADELALARAGHGAKARRVVAVEQRPRVERRLPRHAGAERAHRRRRSAAPSMRGTPDGEPQKDSPQLVRRVVAAQPRPDRPQEARVVHRPVPARRRRRSRRKSCPCSATSSASARVERAADQLRATSRVRSTPR